MADPYVRREGSRVLLVGRRSDGEPVDILVDAAGKLEIVGGGGGGGGGVVLQGAQDASAQPWSILLPTGAARQVDIEAVRDRLPAALEGGRVAVAVPNGLDVDVLTLPAVALDAATLAALETVQVGSLPAVALDAATLLALETTTIAALPAVALDAATLAALETISVAGEVDVTPATPLAASYLPVRLTDGSAFYNAGGGGGGASPEATYAVSLTALTAVTAGKKMLTCFNSAGSGKVLKVLRVWVTGSAAAATGAAAEWRLYRLTSAHTGGTVLTAVKHDTIEAAIPAQVTFQTAPTGGAALGDILAYYDNNSEGQMEATGLATALGTMFPIYEPDLSQEKPITVREGEGFGVISQVGTVGTWRVQMLFSLV